MNNQEFFDYLWQDYTAMTPQATRIEQAFRDRGELIIHDHIALRTFDLEPINLTQLETHLLNLGYSRFAFYEFPEKKLHAWGYVPPEPSLPRIFLSELKTAFLSASSQQIIHRLTKQIHPEKVQDINIFWAGLLWNSITWEDYQTLVAESEYAAWVATLGLRPNHFTLSVNKLQHTSTLEEVLTVVEQLGIPLNVSGGRIKGSPAVLLEQASTIADKMPVTFAGGEVQNIPTCYYEFARRYPDQEGKIYQGFVATSADRIFESTYLKQLKS